MNDFTKEELEYLKLAIYERPHSVTEQMEKMRDKIQSMIDSFPTCDHRSGINFYDEKGSAVHYDTGIYRCRHCEVLFKFLYKNGVCIGHKELE